MTSEDSTPDRAQVRGENIFYLVASLTAAFLIDRFVYSLPFEPRWIGWIFVFLAIIVTVLSFLEFRRMGENPSTSQPSNSLVKSGPYRYSRNPMYLSDLVLQTGISILLGTWWGVVMLIPTWLMYQYWAILPEEAYLERKLGAPYLEYKRAVSRWL
jgi:protein-S-isoprenylcysteine O-methyltransferase Ste14